MNRRIPTRRNPLRRIGAAVWNALEEHKWLPLLIAGVLLLIVNTP